VRPLAIGLVAPPGSGKTTLSAELAATLGWPRVSFGDYVRSVADEKGLPPSREALQDLGAALIAAGWDEFVRAVLGQARRGEDQGIVIDGIRHHMAIATLRTAVAPLRLCIVYLDASDVTRLGRLTERGVADSSELARIDSHSTELEVHELGSIADIRVVSEGQVSDTRDAILQQVERLDAARRGESD
jgi:dephospho-CoA kinase